MNNAALILILEGIVLGGGGFYLHQKNPEGFQRVVTDVEQLVGSAFSNTPSGPGTPATTPATPALTPAPAPTATETPAPAATTPKPPSPVPPPPQTAAMPATTTAASAPAATPAASTWTPPAVLPAQPNWTWTTIAGRVYTNVKVLSVDPTSVMIMYDGGGERVPLAYLPPDLQKLFHYTPSAGSPGTATSAPAPGAAPAAMPDAAPAAPSVIGNLVADNLVRYTTNGLQPVDASVLAPVRYLALYYSAQWCPPCHAFTPQLVQFYNSFKPTHPDFDLIFVSEDHDENQMQDYMREMAMPWPAISYAQLAHPPGTFKGPGIEAFANSGIPDLVLLDSTGKVLSDSFHGSEYVGPEAVVADIQSMVK